MYSCLLISNFSLDLEPLYGILKVGVGRSGEIVVPVSVDLVNTDRRGRAARVRWSVGRVGKSQTVSSAGAQVALRPGAACPLSASLAQSRELPVGRVGLGAGLEHSVGGAGIQLGSEVAALTRLVSLEQQVLGFVFHSRGPSGRQSRRVVVAPPEDEQRILGHRASPGKSGPADLVRHNYLDDRVEGRVGWHVLRDRKAKSDATVIRLVEGIVLRERESRIGVAVQCLSADGHHCDRVSNPLM